jgi:hypothetical protein
MVLDAKCLAGRSKGILQSIVIMLSIACYAAYAETDVYRQELPPYQDNAGWSLMLDRKGVKIYTRDWPGSSFVAIKAEQLIHSSLSNIVANYADIDSFPEWVKDMDDAYSLSAFDAARSRKVYMKMNLPWPLGDRDIVSGQSYEQDEQTKVVRIREWNEADAIPVNKGIVRMPRLNNEFILLPEGQNRTRMIWQGHTEPGGYIPAFLVNWLIEDVFYVSVINMKARFESPEYHKTVNWIQDK